MVLVVLVEMLEFVLVVVEFVLVAVAAATMNWSMTLTVRRPAACRPWSLGGKGVIVYPPAPASLNNLPPRHPFWARASTGK